MEETMVLSTETLAELTRCMTAFMRCSLLVLSVFAARGVILGHAGVRLPMSWADAMPKVPGKPFLHLKQVSAFDKKDHVWLHDKCHIWSFSRRPGNGAWPVFWEVIYWYR